MKKKIQIVVLLIVHLTFYAESQTIGIQAGLKLPQNGITYPNVDIHQNVGFEAGISISQKIDGWNSWNGRVALIYSYSAFSVSDNLGASNAGITYHFVENKVKVPILFEWNRRQTPFIPFIQIGIYCSCALGGKLKAYGEETSLRYKTGGDRFDLGPHLGFGLALTSCIQLVAGYEYGLRVKSLALGDQYVLKRNRGGLVSMNVQF
jgi:hypothetical protein